MKSLALGLLRIYKRWISPAFPPSCRYVPTCSEYAMEAVERYGALRGLAMAGWRVLRCHPLAKGGLDPVVRDGVGNPTQTSHKTRRLDGAPSAGNGADEKLCRASLGWTAGGGCPYVCSDDPEMMSY